MPVQHIDNMDQFKALLESPGLVVVDFTASWCKFIVVLWGRGENGKRKSQSAVSNETCVLVLYLPHCVQ
jgi:hypothetical protein